MYGKGILKGLSVTWKRFWDTYIEDISWAVSGKKRYNTEEGIEASFQQKHQRHLHRAISRRAIDRARRISLPAVLGL